MKRKSRNKFRTIPLAGLLVNQRMIVGTSVIETITRNHSLKLISENSPINKQVHSSTPTEQMKAEIISSQHCIKIDGNYIDIFYMMASNRIHIYIDGALVADSTLNRIPLQVNYMNLIEVAVTYYSRWLTQLNTELQQDIKSINS